MKTHKIGLFLGDSTVCGSLQSSIQMSTFIGRGENFGAEYMGVNGAYGSALTGTGGNNMTQRWNVNYANAYDSVMPDLSINFAVLIGGVNNVGGAAPGNEQAAADTAFTELTALAATILTKGYGKVIICSPLAAGRYLDLQSEQANKNLAYWENGTTDLITQLRNFSLPTDTLFLDLFDLSEDQVIPGRLGEASNSGTFGPINGISITRRDYSLSSTNQAADWLHPNNNLHEDAAKMVYATMLPFL